PPTSNRASPQRPGAGATAQRADFMTVGLRRRRRASMTRAPDMQLPYTAWPEEDRKGWDTAFRAGDPFDDCGRAAYLAAATRRALRASYGRFLGFLSTEHRGLLDLAPACRVDRKIVANYVAWRRPSCADAGIATDLHHLRLALGLICPGTDWSWLLTI